MDLDFKLVEGKPVPMKHQDLLIILGCAINETLSHELDNEFASPEDRQKSLKSAAQEIFDTFNAQGKAMTTDDIHEEVILSDCMKAKKFTKRKNPMRAFLAELEPVIYPQWRDLIDLNKLTMHIHSFGVRLDERGSDLFNITYQAARSNFSTGHFIWRTARDLVSKKNTEEKKRKKKAEDSGLFFF